MARRHLIIGGGTAGINAIRTIREEERERGRDVILRRKRIRCRQNDICATRFQCTH